MNFIDTKGEEVFTLHINPNTSQLILSNEFEVFYLKVYAIRSNIQQILFRANEK